MKLWVNKVGPYNNPQETYNYYYLPFCKPFPDKKPEHSWGGLGEVLQGNELIYSQLDIKYKGELCGGGPLALCCLLRPVLLPGPAENVVKRGICSQKLDQAKADTFREAISRQYWYEFFLDDLVSGVY